MTRIVPFDPTYTQIKKLENNAFVLLIISAIIIAVNWAIIKYFNKPISEQLTNILEIAKVISYVSIIGYLMTTLLTRILFHTVEKGKGTI